MRIREAIAITGFALALQGAAQAGQWDDALRFDTTTIGPLFPGLPPATSAAIQAATANCPGGGALPTFTYQNIVPFTPTSCSSTGQILINIDQFARTNSVLELSSQFQALSGNVRVAERRAWMGSALAAAIPDVSPSPGKTNRIGANVATVEGQSAIGIAYSHISGAFDFNVGASFSTSYEHHALGRAGMGFSW